MKAAEIQIGGRYMTAVSGRLALVEVVGHANARVTPRGRSCPRWRVARVIAGGLHPLPGTRTSAALKPHAEAQS